MEPVYPFKLLQAYSAQDRDIFFGRNEEIEELYEMNFQTNIILIYGASGTGKTSLIKCGFARKFEPHMWMAIPVRRGVDINKSLVKILQENAGDELEENDAFKWLNREVKAKNLTLIPKLISEIYMKHFRPIYLIFDQFEELYILGSQEEQQKFIANIQDVLHVEQPVKIIISIREEYIAHLYEFEKAVSQLMRKKLRVEAMNENKIEQIIHGIAVSKLPLLVKIPVNEVIEFKDVLLKKLRGNYKSSAVQLPYLQIFLDRFYLSISGDATRKTPVTFSVVALKAFDDIGDVLEDYLVEQVTDVSQELGLKNTEKIWKILLSLVTLEGTKEPASLESIQQKLDGKLDEALVKSVIVQLVEKQILRINDDLYEISHDSLGPSIAKRRSIEEIQALEAKKIIVSAFSSFKSGGAYLSEKQISFIVPILPAINISTEERKFVHKSEKLIKRARRAKLIVKITVCAIGVAILLALGVGIVIINKEKKAAIAAKENAEIAQLQAETHKNEALESEKRADEEKKAALEAKNVQLQITEDLKKVTQNLNSALKQADSNATAARRAQLQAEDNATQARESAEYASQQKDTADALRKEADLGKQKSESISNALQSIAAENPRDKLKLALNAYDSNSKYNGGQWTPKIAEALIKAKSTFPGEKLLMLNRTILDIIKYKNSFLIITDAGEIKKYSLQQKNTDSIWHDAGFHYLNNSALINPAKNMLTLTDMSGKTYSYDLSKNAMTKQAQTHKGILLEKNEFVLTGKKLFETTNNVPKNIFEFGNHFATTFEVSADKKNIIAGTADGWLYISGNSITPGGYHASLFQTPNTRVNDIAFNETGEFAATGGTDSKLRITKVSMIGARQPLVYDFGSWVNCLLFIEEKKILIGTAAGELWLFDIDQDRLADACRQKLAKSGVQ